MSTLDFSWMLKEGDCYLCDAYTFPEYRGSGFHRILTRRILNYAKSANYKRALAIVANYNYASAKNYIRLGFRASCRFIVYGKKGGRSKTTLNYR